MSGPSEITVRRAAASDWSAIWPIFCRVVASGDTYTYDPDIGEAEARLAWLHTDDARTVTFVAELGGAVVGTALVKPNLPGLGDHVANAGWMVDPERAGQGIGRAFALGVIDEARELGFRAMQFNAVVATNERALALWRSLGFEVIGTVPDGFRHARTGETDLVIMYRTL